MVKDDIVQRLQNGENIEDIAAELTDAINKANDEYKTIQEAKKKAAAAAAEKEKAEAEDKHTRAVSILEWLGKTNLVDYRADPETGATVREMLEILFSYFPTSMQDPESVGRLAEALQILSMGLADNHKTVDLLLKEDPASYEYLNPNKFFDELTESPFRNLFSGLFDYFAGL